MTRTMTRLTTFSLAAALSLLAIPALAETRGAVAQQAHGDQATFPMAAAEFRQHVAARIEKARNHMEAHITKKQLPADQADAVRARFNTGVATVNEKVEAVCADGTVTEAEAQEVRALVKQTFHHGKKAAPPA